MNDYAGQHEVVSENLTSQILAGLARYVQELKQERKSVQSLFFLSKKWTKDKGNIPRNLKIK